MEPVTAPPTDQLTTRSHRRAIAGAFAVQGLLFISLTLRLPQLKALFELSELELAALMLLLVVLAGVGSVAAELLARRRDSALIACPHQQQRIADPATGTGARSPINTNRLPRQQI